MRIGDVAGLADEVDAAGPDRAGRQKIEVQLRIGVPPCGENRGHRLWGVAQWAGLPVEVARPGRGAQGAGGRQGPIEEWARFEEEQQAYDTKVARRESPQRPAARNRSLPNPAPGTGPD